MKTSIWGPSAWRFLHSVSFAYPEHPSEVEKKAAKELFNALKYLLPCGDCCTHYCKELENDKVEYYLDSRTTLSKWLVNFHNRVNARLKKPIVNYNDIAKEYLLAMEDETCIKEQHCDDSKPTSNKTKTPYILLLFLAIIAIFFYIFYIKSPFFKIK